MVEHQDWGWRLTGLINYTEAKYVHTLFQIQKGSICFLVSLMIVQYFPSQRQCSAHIFGKLLIRPTAQCAVLYSLLPKLYLILSKSFKFYFWFWLCRFLAMAMAMLHIIKSSNEYFSWARWLKTSLSPDRMFSLDKLILSISSDLLRWAPSRQISQYLRNRI